MTTSSVSVDSTDSSRIQLQGLVSNLDITTIIDALVKAESTQETAYEEQVATLGDEQDTWAEVQTQLNTFLDTVDVLRQSSTWSARSATSTDESVLTASAADATTRGTYKIIVDQLAAAHSIAADDIDTIVGTSGNSSTTDLSTAGVLTADSTFYVNDKAIKVTISGTSSNDTLAKIRDTINSTTFADGDEVSASIIDGTLVLTASDSGQDHAIRLRDDASTHILEKLGLVGQNTADQYTTSLFHFEDGTGTTAANSVTGGGSATLNGATWSSDAKFGSWALDFDRSGSQSATAASSANNTFTTAMTLEAWVKPDAAQMTATQGIVSKAGAAAGNNAYAVDLNADGTVTFRLSSDGSTWTSLTSAAKVTGDEYSHVAATLEDGKMKLYINGTQDANTQTFSGSVYASTAAVSVGNSQSGYFDGRIDEVKLSNTARSDFNVKNLLVSQQDAKFSVNSVSVTRSSNTSLTDVISNVTLNLEDEGTSTLTIASDTTGIKTDITNFVTAYNTIQDYLRGITTVLATGTAGEDVYTGKLQGDLTITTLSRELRSYVYALVDRPAGQTASQVKYLGALGIDTQGEDYTLVVEDDTMIDTALASHFDDVQYLFQGSDESIAKKIYTTVDKISSTADGTIETKDQSLQARIDDLNTRITNEKLKLELVKESLTTKFTNMESRITDLNTQLTEMLQNLGSSSSSSS